MATSETLAFRLGLCFMPDAFSKTRASPIYSTSLWNRVVSRTPAVSTAAFDCYFTVDAAFAHFREARQPHRQTVRTGLSSITRLQNSLYATTRSLAGPAPARALTTELSPRRSPFNGISYNYAGISQFPRPVFHRQDSRPYGLRRKSANFQRTVGLV